MSEIEAKSGYVNDKRTFKVRPMSFSEFLECPWHFSVLSTEGKVLTVKKNGQVKTWKTRPHDAEVPYKYGLYTYGKIRYQNGIHFQGPEPVIILETIHAQN